MPSTVDDLYARQIRKLTLSERLDLARRILNEAADAEGSTPRPRSLLELEGLGASLWDSVEAQEYVRNLRQEWDQRR